MANYLMSETQKAKIDEANTGAKILIWSGSQAILNTNTYNFYSALKFPVSDAHYVKFYFSYETDGAETDNIRMGATGTGSGVHLIIDTSSAKFEVYNNSGGTITMFAIYMYLI